MFQEVSRLLKNYSFIHKRIYIHADIEKITIHCSGRVWRARKVVCEAKVCFIRQLLSMLEKKHFEESKFTSKKYISIVAR